MRAHGTLMLAWFLRQQRECPCGFLCPTIRRGPRFCSTFVVGAIYWLVAIVADVFGVSEPKWGSTLGDIVWGGINLSFCVWIVLRHDHGNVGHRHDDDRGGKREEVKDMVRVVRRDVLSPLPA